MPGAASALARPHLTQLPPRRPRAERVSAGRALVTATDTQVVRRRTNRTGLTLRPSPFAGPGSPHGGAGRCLSSGGPGCTPRGGEGRTYRCVVTPPAEQSRVVCRKSKARVGTQWCSGGAGLAVPRPPSSWCPLGLQGAPWRTDSVGETLARRSAYPRPTCFPSFPAPGGSKRPGGSTLSRSFAEVKTPEAAESDACPSDSAKPDTAQTPRFASAAVPQAPAAVQGVPRLSPAHPHLLGEGRHSDQRAPPVLPAHARQTLPDAGQDAAAACTKALAMLISRINFVGSAVLAPSMSSKKHITVLDPVELSPPLPYSQVWCETRHKSAARDPQNNIRLVHLRLKTHD